MSWKIEKLGDLLAPSGFDRGGSNEYPILSITMHEGLVDQSAKFKKRVASSDTSSYRVVYANELVVGFPIDEGVLGFQTRYPAAVVSPAYGIWKLKRPTETHIPFVQGYLRSGEARGIYASRMRGAVARRRSISREDFLDIDIPFPPLDEQKRIAAVLDKAGALRRQRQESLQLTEKFLQSVFIQMFGDPATNPKGWPSELLGNLVTEGDTINYGVVQPGAEHPGGIVLIRLADLANPDPQLQRTKRIDPGIDATYGRSRLVGGELLIGCVGYTIGVSCIAPKEWAGANIARAVARVRLRPGIPAEFVLQQIRTPAVQQYFRGERRVAGQPTLNIKQIKETSILLPPPELRDRFALLYNKTQEGHAEKVKSALFAEKLFMAIQQRAFRGELDLSRLKLEDEAEPVAIGKVPEPVVVQGKYRRPGAFIAPPEIEAQMKAFEETLDFGPGDSIPWSEDYFKYRTLSQVLRPPFNCTEIMEKVHNDMPEATYEDVRRKLFEYLEEGILEQQFDNESREIVFAPRA